MADFIAVIRRAVDGLSNNTPEMRARVYEKARAAVVRQLENMSPRPPEHMLQRQLDKLDQAIREVEAEHADALPPLDQEPQVAAAPVAAAGTVATAAVAQPAWTEPEPETVAEAQPVQDRGMFGQEAADEAVSTHEPVEPAPAVTGDDWADAHMAEPAVPVATDEPVVDQPVADEPPAVVEEPTAEPAIETVQADTDSWSTEPSFGRDEHEAVYAGLYDSPVHEPAALEPVSVSAPEAPAKPQVEPDIAAAPYVDAPTAEETWSRDEEPHAVAPGWETVTPLETLPATTDPTFGEPVQVEADLPSEPPQAGIRVDSVEDWLQSRALDPVPVIPAASWDLPAATETAANRVPELPEIDTGLASASYTPTDEFPAYVEPLHVEASRDYVTPEGLSLPDADPTVVGKLTSTPATPAIDADDFSQWFQEHVDQGGKDSGAAGSASAAAAPAPGSEWDEHVDSFAPSAKGAQVEMASQPDGMEALVSGYGQQPAYRLEPKKRRNFAPVIIGALVLAVLGGAGYLAWSMRDQIGSMVANLTGEIAPAEPTAQTPTAQTTPAATEPAAETAAAPEVATPPADGSAATQKFTQRLRPDGTEVDEGVGSAPIDGAPAEGRSVSAQTVASTVEPTDPPAATSGAAATQAPGTAANTAAVAGGEKLFLYEERIGQATPVAVPGSITWTAVRENGADGRPDPQIQGRINVPERGISALLTFKRNTDNSLPASHIIEVVFSVPADFEGGAVENLQRIAMKRTEQDRGDPLVAVTAKVTDDTYLVALNDFEDVVKRNMELLSTRAWIDIPVTYRNGRRALITLDKGTTGTNVFDQVIREWAALAPAAPAN